MYSKYFLDIYPRIFVCVIKNARYDVYVENNRKKEMPRNDAILLFSYDHYRSLCDDIIPQA